MQWKINRKAVSSLNEDHFKTLQEGVAFLTADDTLDFKYFVDAVDAQKGAGMNKVAVLIGKID